MGANDIKLGIGIDLSSLNSALNKAERAVLRHARRIERIGTNLQNSITLPVIALGTAGVASAVKLDKMNKSLIGIMGDAKLAANEFDRLRKIAKDPGMTLQTAVEASVKLQAIGYSADKAAEQMKILGNAIALVGGGGEALSGVTLAMVQILGKGKVHAEEINQMAERLPQIRKAMQDAFGTADTEKIQKMGISAEDFIDGIIKQLGKLPKAQKTLQDQFNHLKDDMMILGASLGNIIIPILFKAIGVIQKIANAWLSMDNDSKKTLTNIALALAVGGPVLAGMGRMAVAATEAWKTFRMLPLPLKIIAGALAVVVIFWDEIKSATIAASKAAAEYYNNNTTFRGGWEDLKKNLKNTWAVLKASGKFAVTEIQTATEAVGAALVGDLKMAWKILGEGGDQVKEIFRAMAQEMEGNAGFAELAKMLGTGAYDLFGTEENKGKTQIEIALNTIEAKLGDLKDKTLAWWNSLGGTGGGIVEVNKKIISQFDMINFLTRKIGDRAMGGRGVSPIASGGSGVQYQGQRGPVIPIDQRKVDIINQAKESMGELVAETENLADATSKLATPFDAFIDAAHKFMGSGKLEDGFAAANEAMQNLGASVNKMFDNYLTKIEQVYQADKKRIENSSFDEKRKNRLLINLEDEYNRKKTKALRNQARINKATAIFDATIAGIVAVSKVLANPALATVVGVLAAANVAAIASTPLPMAKGGIVKGRTFAEIGEYSNAPFNPEVVSPLNKLKDMLGSTMGGVNITLGLGTRIVGSDLALTLERANTSRQRTKY